MSTDFERSGQAYTPLEEAAIREALSKRKGEPLAQIAERLSETLFRPAAGIANKMQRMAENPAKGYRFLKKPDVDTTPVSFVKPNDAADLIKKAYVTIELAGFKWEGVPTKVVFKSDHFNIYF